MKRINIVGYGLFPKLQISQEAIEVIRSSTTVLTLAQVEEIEDLLQSEGIRYISLKHLYQQDLVRNEVYYSVAERVLQEFYRSEGNVCYLTYGNPMLLDTPAQILIDEGNKYGFDVNIVSGQSFLDVITARMSYPIDGKGLIVVDATTLVEQGLILSPKIPAFIAQVGAFRQARVGSLSSRSQEDLSDLFSYLLTFYPKTHEVTFCDSNEFGDDLIFCKLALDSAILAADAITYATTLFIPPCTH